MTTKNRKTLMRALVSTIIQWFVLLMAVSQLVDCVRGQASAKVVQVATPVCVQIARAYSRADIEKLCQEGGDFAAVLTDLLGENARLKANTGQGDAGADGAENGR